MNPVVPAGLEAALADRYRLERELGAGGMSTVFLAHDLKHDRDVALKVLRPELASAVVAERFLAEIRTTAALHHPHILPLFDSGQAGDFLFYAMPYVEGESLRDRLTREGQLSIADAVRIAAAVASALDYAHRHNVIHRDIKPDNILLHEGEPIVADFGIALAVSQAGKDRLTATGLSIGTPQYMSPEQATGNMPLDARSDIYSLGAVLYEMLAGEAPFTGPSAHAIIAKLLTEHPISLRTVRDTVPGNVDAAVQRALATAPVDRFATAAEFAAALDDPTGPTEMPRAGGRGRRIGAGLGIVALLAAAGWWMTQERAGAQPAPALERVQLTFTGHARLPALSPDGKRVAYLIEECGHLEVCSGDIVITDMAATTTLTLVRGAGVVDMIDWTSDGRYLIYHHNAGERPGSHLVSTLGGAPRFLGEGSATQLGQSDSLIVAQKLYGVVEWLYIVPISSGVKADSIRVPKQRDGSLGLSVMSAPTGDHFGVVQYWDSTWTLLVVDRQGVIHDSLDGIYRGSASLNWAPAGDALIATLSRPDASGWDVLRLPLGRSPGASGVDTVARLGSLVDGGLIIGRTGAAVYAEGRLEWSLHGFARSAPMLAEVGGAVLLSGTGPVSTVRIDPAGRRILLRRPVGPSPPPMQQLVLVPFDGGAAVPLGPPRSAGFSFSWSADGSRVFVAENGNEGAALMEVDPETGNGKTIGGRLPSPVMGLAGLPGGGAVASTWTGEQSHVHLSGIPGRPDTSFAPTPNGRYSGMVLLPRPDGLSVATTSFPLDSAGMAMEILEVDIRSAKTRVLARFPVTDRLRLAAWNDNTHLDFFRPLQAGTGWYRLDVTTGKISEVARMSQPLGYYALSADGRRGALVLSQQRSDIMLIPNFAERLK